MSVELAEAPLDTTIHPAITSAAELLLCHMAAHIAETDPNVSDPMAAAGRIPLRQIIMIGRPAPNQAGKPDLTQSLFDRFDGATAAAAAESRAQPLIRRVGEWVFGGQNLIKSHLEKASRGRFDRYHHRIDETMERKLMAANTRSIRRGKLAAFAGRLAYGWMSDRLSSPDDLSDPIHDIDRGDLGARVKAHHERRRLFGEAAREATEESVYDRGARKARRRAARRHNGSQFYVDAVGPRQMKEASVSRARALATNVGRVL